MNHQEFFKAVMEEASSMREAITNHSPVSKRWAGCEDWAAETIWAAAAIGLNARLDNGDPTAARKGALAFVREEARRMRRSFMAYNMGQETRLDSIQVERHPSGAVVKWAGRVAHHPYRTWRTIPTDWVCRDYHTDDLGVEIETYYPC